MMKIFGELKKHISLIIAFAIVFPGVMPILAYAEQQPILEYNGSVITASVSPYEGEYGLMADARDAAALLSLEYRENKNDKTFTFVTQDYGEVVLSHYASEFSSGGRTFECMPYFYYQNTVPMIEIGFVCELFGKEYEYDETSGSITVNDKAVLSGNDAGEASLTDAGRRIFGNLVYSGGVANEYLDVDLSIQSVPRYVYGMTQVISKVKLGTITMNRGDTAKWFDYTIGSNYNESTYNLCYTVSQIGKSGKALNSAGRAIAFSTNSDNNCTLKILHDTVTGTVTLPQKAPTGGLDVKIKMKKYGSSVDSYDLETVHIAGGSNQSKFLIDMSPYYENQRFNYVLMFECNKLKKYGYYDNGSNTYCSDVKKDFTSDEEHSSAMRYFLGGSSYEVDFDLSDKEYDASKAYNLKGTLGLENGISVPNGGIKVKLYLQTISYGWRYYYYHNKFDYVGKKTYELGSYNLTKDKPTANIAINTSKYEASDTPWFLLMYQAENFDKTAPIYPYGIVYHNGSVKKIDSSPDEYNFYDTSAGGGFFSFNSANISVSLPKSSGALAGECGESCSYDLDINDGLLVISGTGEVTTAPWSDFNNYIKRVVVERGITAISADIAGNEICLPDTLKKIADGVTLPDTICYGGTDKQWNALGYTAGAIYTMSNSLIYLDSVSGQSAKLVFGKYVGSDSIIVEHSLNGVDWSEFKADNELTAESEYALVSGFSNDEDHYFRIKADGGYFGGVSNVVKIAGYKYAPPEDFEFSDGMINAYIGHDKEVVIPPVIDGEEVKRIHISAFSDTGVESIVIPRTVGSIYGSVYSRVIDCDTLKNFIVDPDNEYYSSADGLLYNKDFSSLIQYPAQKDDEEFYIPDTVTRISYCLGNDYIKRIHIPSSLTNLATYGWDRAIAVSGLPSLEEIFVDENNAEFCSVDGVLYSKDKTKLMYYPPHKESDVFNIPDTVTGFGKYAFANNPKIKSVVVPDGVSDISDVFSGCANIEAVTLPKNLKIIGEGAFDGCSRLKNVDIPDSVSEIGYRAFRGCSALESIVIPDAVSKINSTTFSGCSNLKSVVIPENVQSIESDSFNGCKSLEGVTFSNNLTKIGSYAFCGCEKLTKLDLPDNLQKIANSAFYNCYGLTEISLGSGIYEIGDNAFFGCKLIKKFDVDESNGTYCSVDGVLYDRTKQNLIAYPPAKTDPTYSVQSTVTKIGAGAFANAKRLTRVTLPNGITEIADNAFRDCSALRTVNIPSGLKIIGSDAFSDCSKLTAITLNDGLQTIDYSAFWGCSALESISIPSSVTTIGNYAFSSCKSLKSISVASSNTKYSSQSGILYDKAKTKILICPPAISLTSVSLPQTVKSIPSDAFDDCENIEKIIIPSSVSEIEKYTFDNLTSLNAITVASGNANYSSDDGVLFTKEKDVLIKYPPKRQAIEYKVPDSVSEISSSAFEYCELTEISLPESLSELGSYVFRDSKNLESINIPTGIDSIPNMSFYGCSNLKEIYIPINIKTIGYNAFDWCSSLTDVYIPESVEKIDSSAFGDCDNLEYIKVNENNKNYCSYNYALYSKDMTTLIQYPAALTDVKLVIPNGVVNIENYAFYLTKFETLDIPATLEDFGKNNLNSCSNLRQITVREANNKFCSSDGILFTKDMTTLVRYPRKRVGDSYTVPDCVNIIAADAMRYAEVKSVKIHGGVKEIGKDAFGWCHSLTDISVSRDNENYTSYDGCLYNKNMTELIEYPLGKNEAFVRLPNGIKKIGDTAMFANFAAERIVLPETTETIGRQSFNYTTNLKAIEIPTSVGSIDEFAFNSCESLTDIYYTGSREQWEGIAIGRYNEALDGVTVHYNSHMDDVSIECNSDVKICEYADGVLTIKTDVTNAGNTTAVGKCYIAVYDMNGKLKTIFDFDMNIQPGSTQNFTCDTGIYTYADGDYVKIIPMGKGLIPYGKNITKIQVSAK